MSPLVSIILPNYNHERYLPDRINSILEQTFQDVELIILDDCSTDNSRKVIEQYRNHPKVTHIVYNTQNGGTSYKQWKKGITYAKGELIWIAESDDLANMHFLEYLTPHFEDPKVVLAFSGIQYFTDKIIKVPLLSKSDYVRYDSKSFVSKNMMLQNGIPNASMVLFRKATYESLETEKNDWAKMKLAGDWLLWSYLASKGDIVEALSILDFCRRHEGCATNRFRKLGCDLIEGVKVLNFGRKMYGDAINYNEVYYRWWNNYLVWTAESLFYTKVKVLIVAGVRYPQLGLYIYYKLIKRLTKKAYRKLCKK